MYIYIICIHIYIKHINTLNVYVYVTCTYIYNYICMFVHILRIYIYSSSCDKPNVSSLAHMLALPFGRCWRSVSKHGIVVGFMGSTSQSGGFNLPGGWWMVQSPCEYRQKLIVPWKLSPRNSSPASRNRPVSFEQWLLFTKPVFLVVKNCLTMALSCFL